MNAEDTERLQACVQELAVILYRNTPAESLTSLEGIEQSVRQHMLEQVSHQVGVFLSKRQRAQSEGNRDNSRVALDD